VAKWIYGSRLMRLTMASGSPALTGGVPST
jgi:hypothetical protein